MSQKSGANSKMSIYGVFLAMAYKDLVLYLFLALIFSSAIIFVRYS